MKTTIKYLSLVLIVLFAFQSQAQQRDLDNFRFPDKRGINQFETPKDTISTYEGVHVRIGGAFALQFQALDHENGGPFPDRNGEPTNLIEIGNNFNLPTANLDLDVQLYPGLRMHLRTYLSSKHHPEPFVKDGYFQIDRLDFISPGFLDNVMDHLTIRIGHMETNYGDAHFRRTDNAMAFYNPFVGNYIMDSFTTEVGGEVYFRKNNFLLMGGMTNGKLNQSVTNPQSSGVALIGKIGYDNYETVGEDDLRFRLTGSVYHTNKIPNSFLYGGDRAGSRYYLVLEEVGATPAANFTSGRYNPAFGNEITAFMINPFLKYGGLEFFGTYERAGGKRLTQTDERYFTQWAGDLIYRFGQNENFYVAGRYNTINGDDVSGVEIDIDRIQIAAGWFMTKNIMTKLEYVKQEYDGFRPGTRFHQAQFDGLVLEAVISF